MHELGIVTTTCDAMHCCLLRFAILRGLVQVPATASSTTRHLPPDSELSSPRQLASVAWPDVTSSPRSESSLLEALQPEMKRAETQFAEVASDLQASQRGVGGGRGGGS